MSISDAVSDLAELLSAGKDAQVALVEISAEYELHPKLVERKFIEKYSVELEKFVPSEPPHIRSRNLARAKARAWAKHGVWGEEIIEPGTIFLACGKEWAFVGLRRGCNSADVIALDVTQVHDPSYDDVLWRGCVPCLRGLTYEAAADTIAKSVVP